LAQDRPALFRVDATGVGQPMTGDMVSAGHAFRPFPRRSPVQLRWRVTAQLTVGGLQPRCRAPGLELRDILQSLGLELGQAAHVRWF
jgi:hypothetical protein